METLGVIIGVVLVLAVFALILLGLVWIGLRLFRSLGR